METKFTKANFDTLKNERSLTEITNISSIIEDWNEIEQPKKIPLLDILLDTFVELKNTDLEVIIDDRIIKCHYYVLQSYSELFLEMGHQSLVMLPKQEITLNAFNAIYNWMLIDNAIVHRENVIELLIAARLLKVKKLEDQCWACLNDKRIYDERAFSFYIESLKFQYDKLNVVKNIQEIMIKRIKKFFLTVVASKEFTNMKLGDVCNLLKLNSIGVQNEIEIFMSAIHWLHYDFSERKQYIADILKCVRFNLISPWELADIKMNTTCPEIMAVIENSEVQKMIDCGLIYNTLKYHNSMCYLEKIEELKLEHPENREWIRDRKWNIKVENLSKNMSSYEKFCERLNYIWNIGPEHWNCVEYSGNGPYDTLVKDKYFSRVQMKQQTAKHLLNSNNFLLKLKQDMEMETFDGDTYNFSNLFLMVNEICEANYKTAKNLYK